MNPENLVRNEDRTPSQRRANAIKAGKASGEARLRKKRLRELAESFGNMAVSDKDKAIMATLGIEPSEMTRKMQMVISLYNKAMKGDVAAFNAVRDILGEKPTDNVAMEFPKSLRIEVVDGGVPFASSEEEIAE